MPVFAQAWGLATRTYAIHRDRGFAQSADLVLGAVDSATRLALVNTPHNPTRRRHEPGGDAASRGRAGRARHSLAGR